VGEGLGLGVVLGLGLGSQVLTSTREVIIWQGVEIWHNIICVNGRERVKEMIVKLKILKCLLCNVGQAIILVIMTWTKTRKGTVSKPCYKEHKDDIKINTILQSTHLQSRIYLCA